MRPAATRPDGPNRPARRLAVALAAVCVALAAAPAPAAAGPFGLFPRRTARPAVRFVRPAVFRAVRPASRPVYSPARPAARPLAAFGAFFDEAFLQRRGQTVAPCGPSFIPTPLRRLLIPQSICGGDFRAACRRHDAGYTAGYRDEFGRVPTRRQVDDRFRRETLAACRNSSLPGLCRFYATLDYAAVRLYGGFLFRIPATGTP